MNMFSACIKICVNDLTKTSEAKPVFKYILCSSTDWVPSTMIIYYLNGGSIAIFFMFRCRPQCVYYQQRTVKGKYFARMNFTVRCSGNGKLHRMSNIFPENTKQKRKRMKKKEIKSYKHRNHFPVECANIFRTTFIVYKFSLLDFLFLSFSFGFGANLLRLMQELTHVFTN